MNRDGEGEESSMSMGESSSISRCQSKSDDRGLCRCASLQRDFGHTCLAFAKLDSGEIRRIKKETFEVEPKTESQP